MRSELQNEAISLRVEALPSIDLDEVDGNVENIGTNIEGHSCDLDWNSYWATYFLNCSSSASGMVRFHCNGAGAAAIKVFVSSQITGMDRNSCGINDIEVFGVEHKPEMEAGDGMITAGDGFKTPTIGPTEKPQQTNQHAGQDDVLQNAIPAVFKNAREENYRVVWTPKFSKAIPYAKLMAAVASNPHAETDFSEGRIMGFLANRGYINYVLAEEKAAVDDSKRSRPKVGANDVVKSIKLLQKFNGFPETGQVSKDIMEYIEKPRCGVGDVEFSVDKSDEEKKLCFTFIENKDWDDVNLDCLGLEGTNRKTNCGPMPPRDMPEFIQNEQPYYIQIDLSFEPFGIYTWDSLVENFAIWYNFDKTIGEEEGRLGYGDKVEIFAAEDKLGFQFQEFGKDLLEIKKVSNYTLSKTELVRREFKIRIDVEEGNVAYLLINGKDMGQMRYNHTMKSAVVLQWRFKVPEIITARICKRGDETTLRKKRTVSTSLHKWGTNTITFNYQNYSSSLGEQRTRTAVTKALAVLTKGAQLTFIEKQKHEIVMLSYMFIKGKHADGMTFRGAGAEKAHAFSPVHSEIHFNDHENFQLEKSDKATSIFYVALHETGHALGLRHTDYQDAVMNSAYHEWAFDVHDLHREDRRALVSHYGDGTGEVRVLPEEQRNVAISIPYRPRLPLPRECIGNIDAGFMLGSKIYLISNTFIWQYNAVDRARIGPPRRLSDVLAGWNYATRAAFVVGSKVVLLSDGLAHVYRQFGPIFTIDRISTVNELLNSEGTNIQFPRIKAAFTIPHPSQHKRYLTTLVTGVKEFYEVTWKNSKVALDVQRVNNPSGTTLIGKTYGGTEFNAAVAFERTNKKSGEVSWELYKFDRKYVKMAQIYPNLGEVRSRDPYQEVSKMFNIDAWCPDYLLQDRSTAQ